MAGFVPEYLAIMRRNLERPVSIYRTGTRKMLCCRPARQGLRIAREGPLKMSKSVRLVQPKQTSEEQTSEEMSANTIDKVRDLLFGEAKREHDGRIAELDASMTAMNDRIAETLKAMEAKMDAMSRALSSKHDESMRQIGEAFVSVGRQISSLGSTREHDRDSKA